MPKVAVVILNFNGRKHLSQFIPKVIEHSSGHEVWVVDNGSHDGSTEWLRMEHPEVKLVELENNLGFAGGYNEGLKHIPADYYILLNSDVEVTASWIEPVIAEMHTENWTACQPKILSFFEREYFEHAGAAGGFLDKNYFPFCRGRLFSEVEKDQGQYQDSRQIFWATGACMFIRSEAFHEVGGFDANFFAHMEEIDMCWRMQRRGYSIGYSSKAVVYHVGGGTLGYGSPRKTYLNFRNSLQMIVKNHQGVLAGKLFWRMVLDGIAGGFFLLKGQWKHSWAVLRAHYFLYTNLRSTLRVRKVLRSFDNPEAEVYGVKDINLVFRYFVKKNRTYSEL